MSAAEKLVTPPSRGMGSLADCPLARAYKWTSPIQDYHRQTAPLGELAHDEVRYLNVPLAPVKVPDKVVTTVVVERRTERRAYKEAASPANMDPVQRDIFLAEYRKMCAGPQAYGQFKELCEKYQLSPPDTRSYLVYHKLFRARRY